MTTITSGSASASVCFSVSTPAAMRSAFSAKTSGVTCSAMPSGTRCSTSSSNDHVRPRKISVKRLSFAA